jgi:hypothetical protein
MMAPCSPVGAYQHYGGTCCHYPLLWLQFNPIPNIINIDYSLFFFEGRVTKLILCQILPNMRWSCSYILSSSSAADLPVWAIVYLRRFCQICGHPISPSLDFPTIYLQSGLEHRQCGRRDPSSWPRGTLYPKTLALTLPTSGGRSVGIVRSRT